MLDWLRGYSPLPPWTRGAARGRPSRASNDPKYIPKQPNPRAQDRRRRDLIEAFVRALGPDAVTDVVLVQVRRAAELVALAEAARAAALTGGLQDVVGLIRIENAAARAVRALGLKIETPAAAARFSPMKAVREAAEAANKAKAIRKEARSGVTAKGPPNERDATE